MLRLRCFHSGFDIVSVLIKDHWQSVWHFTLHGLQFLACSVAQCAKTLHLLFNGGKLDICYVRGLLGFAESLIDTGNISFNLASIAPILDSRD